MASSSYKPDIDVKDIETGGETKSLINNTNNINSTYSNYEDIDLKEQQEEQRGDGVAVYLCCLCCIPAGTKKKTYFPEPRYCTDLFFALFWVTTFCLGLGIFFETLRLKGQQGLSADIQRAFKFLTPKQREQWFNITLTAISSTMVGVAGAYLFMKYCIEGFLRYCALFVIAGSIFVAISSSSWELLLLPLGLVCMLYMFREKIPVTIEIMKITMKALDKHISVLCVGFLAIFMHVLWFIICSILYVSLSTQKLQQTNESLYLFCLCCLCFYYVWTAELIRYTVDYVASATVGSWVCFDSSNANMRDKYLNANPRHRVQATYPVLNGIKHAFFTNIGTMSFGAFLIALIETLKFLIRALCSSKDGKNGGWGECIIMCILSCCRDQLEYMNRYVVTYNAIFNTSFLDGAKEFSHLLKNSGAGLTVVYNDECSGIIMLASSVTIGIFSSCLTMIVAVSSFGIVKYATIGGITFVFSVFASLTTLEVVKAAFSALFICYCAPETKAAFERNHPEEFNDLNEKFKMAANTTRERFVWCCFPCCIII